MNPYLIKEPAAISFSGGRTSAYMLYRIWDAHEGRLPDDVIVCFANTGKEMPQTLDFVHQCSVEWGIPIVWLECRCRQGNDGENKFVYETVVVNYETASRNGEPFEQLITARSYLPNPVARFCTAELKVRRISDYLESVGMGNPLHLIGIRADEPARAIKMHNKKTEGHDCYCPLYVDGITKEDVGRFWQDNYFDLMLPNNNGTTVLGNCDLCFLKGMNKRLSIMSAMPELSDWWSEQEEKINGTFRADQPSYKKLKEIAITQQDFFGYVGDIDIPCYCGD